MIIVKVNEVHRGQTIKGLVNQGVELELYFQVIRKPQEGLGSR